MNKSELIDIIADHTDASKAEAQRHLEAAIEAISTALENGDSVQLTGFGTFEVRERSARTGRNPQTGEEIQIAATKAPAFKAGKGLKDLVAGKK